MSNADRPARENLPRLSVVAPTFGRASALPAFVAPLLGDPALDELVIAVDGSDDGSVEWLARRGKDDSRLRYLDLPNRGAGPARQAGIDAATGEVILLLDDDVIAAPGLAAGHLRHHADLESKLVIGYMPNEWHAVGEGRRGIAAIYRRAYELHCAGFRDDPAFVLHGFWGGNFSMPRRDFLDIGVVGLDVARGQDDREFGLRCARAGVRPVFDESLRGEHLYDRDLRSFRRDCRLQGESRQMIHRAHPDLVGETLNSREGGPHVADAVGMGLPAPIRRLWPWLARDPLFGPVCALLRGLFTVALRERHLGLEVAAARALGSIETMRGVLDRS